MENLNEAQANMRVGYMNGSIGVVVSGTMWLSSGFVAFLTHPLMPYRRDLLVAFLSSRSVV